MRIRAGNARLMSPQASNTSRSAPRCSVRSQSWKPRASSRWTTSRSNSAGSSCSSCSSTLRWASSLRLIRPSRGRRLLAAEGPDELSLVLHQEHRQQGAHPGVGGNAEQGADGVAERRREVVEPQLFARPGDRTPVAQGAAVVTAGVVVGAALVDDAETQQVGFRRRDDDVVAGADLEQEAVDLVDVIGEQDRALDVREVAPHHREAAPDSGPGRDPR